MSTGPVVIGVAGGSGSGKTTVVLPLPDPPATPITTDPLPMPSSRHPPLS